MSVKIPQSHYEPIPEGIYRATIQSVDEVAGEFGQQLKFVFQLDPFEGYPDGKQLHAWASAKFGTKTKLYSWTASVLGTIAPDYVFDSDDLLNKSVLLVIGHRLGKDGNTYDNIESVKPGRNVAPATIEQINKELGDFEVPA